jgi:hypothetical protein
VYVKKPEKKAHKKESSFDFGQDTLKSKPKKRRYSSGAVASGFDPRIGCLLLVFLPPVGFLYLIVKALLKR